MPEVEIMFSIRWQRGKRVESWDQFYLLLHVSLLEKLLYLPGAQAHEHVYKVLLLPRACYEVNFPNILYKWVIFTIPDLDEEKNIASRN